MDIPEEYVALVQVLAEDLRLRRWFESLSSMPVNRRSSELGQVALKFQEAGHERLAHLVRSLNDDRIYGAVKAVADAFGKR